MSTSFHPDTLVIRTLVNASDKPERIEFAWAYWEITGIRGKKYTRRFLFSEPLSDEDHENIPRTLRIEPLTKPAREAIDLLRKANGYTRINWRYWHLANPEVTQKSRRRV